MHVAEIWRYPVKSMRGERLEEAELLAAGIPGDRVVQVHAPDGRVITARNYPELLGLSGTLGADGEPLVDGLPWSDPCTLRAVRLRAWDGASLARGAEVDRFDVLPITIATDGAAAAMSIDPRRLRPNVVVAGVEGLAERDWPGRRIHVGTAVLQVVKLRSRCVMTNFDPASLEPDPSVLRRIVEDFDDLAALDCSVLEPGLIAAGDEVVLGVAEADVGQDPAEPAGTRPGPVSEDP
jgi:uncharacterized protein YcbX